jgi:hypothetical protein
LGGHHYEHPEQGSIAYWDIAAIHIQDRRAQGWRATVAWPTQTQTLASSVYAADIESETTQTECPYLYEKKASELERELEVEALNHLL